jgi:tryptophan synthase alpha chain
MPDSSSRPISERFRQLKEKGEKALVLFVTAGDPALDQLPAILQCLQAGGADIIELGIPFSDPIADGPTIQASTQRALDLGVTPTAVFETLSQIKLDIPVVLMGYYNPVLRMGLEKFARKAKEAGASGTIITDFTPEEADDWIAASQDAGLDNIFLTAPTSTEERITAVAKCSQGFVYAVSRTGVTGALESVPVDVADLVARIKKQSDTPVCVGFGISKPEHVRTITQVADGAVVGSWLVDLLANEWKEGAGAAMIEAKVRALKQATLPTG